jgi:hypothetical protein
MIGISFSAQISTSMEAYGAEAEFIRNGVDMSTWEENLKYIKQCSDIDVISSWSAYRALTS